MRSVPFHPLNTRHLPGGRRLFGHGPGQIATMLDWMRDWMIEREYDSVDQLRGLLAAPTGADHSAQERSSYVSAMRRANTGLYGSW